MDVPKLIAEILADDWLDDESVEITKVDEIESLIEDVGWPAVRECLLEVLRDDGQSRNWRTAADAFWGAVLDRRDLPTDELIALLHHRFDPTGLVEDDLVWSIVSKLKGIDYLSDYEPLRDPGVIEELRKVRGAT